MPELPAQRWGAMWPDTAALQYLPELLLGGGGPDNDDRCARSAAEAFGDAGAATPLH